MKRTKTKVPYASMKMVSQIDSYAMSDAPAMTEAAVVLGMSRGALMRTVQFPLTGIRT